MFIFWLQEIPLWLLNLLWPYAQKQTNRRSGYCFPRYSPGNCSVSIRAQTKHSVWGIFIISARCVIRFRRKSIKRRVFDEAMVSGYKMDAFTPPLHLVYYVHKSSIITSTFHPPFCHLIYPYPPPLWLLPLVQIPLQRTTIISHHYTPFFSYKTIHSHDLFQIFLGIDRNTLIFNLN